MRNGTPVDNSKIESELAVLLEETLQIINHPLHKEKKKEGGSNGKKKNDGAYHDEEESNKPIGKYISTDQE